MRQEYHLADGTKVPGVTSITYVLGWKVEGLIHWAYNVGRAGKDLDREREALTTAGSLCHAFAEADIKHTPRPDVSQLPAEIVEKAEASFVGYLKWRESTRLELVVSEVPLVSERLRFGGRLDAVAVMDGEAGVVDFKSAKALYPDTVVQVAAYRWLWNETHPDAPVKRGHVLRWNPDGGFTHHALSDDALAAGWESFQHCLALYDLKKRLK
jgi:hypothetical protein